MDLRKLGRNQHWFVTGLLALALIPLYSLEHLTLVIDWSSFLGIYWIGTTAQSIFCAVILFVIGFPLEKTLAPVWRRYWQEKPRISFAVLFAIFMIWLFGWWGGLMLAVDVLAVLEMLDRSRAKANGFKGEVRKILLPAAYLFLGLVIVYGYIHLIAGVEFAGAYDSLFNKLDAGVFRWTVCGADHAVAKYIPLAVYSWLDWVYVSLYSVVGAGIVLTALCSGEARALRYVGTILTAYYVAVGLFYLFPTLGPFSHCTPPGAQLIPHTHDIQQGLLMKARAQWNHSKETWANLIEPSDYYIDFPCMHIPLPTIALWYLRHSRRLVFFLVPYILILGVAVTIFGWHYFTGMAAGVAVGFFAIAVVR